ncbi:uncharacterized protein OCT59_012280 [Rhizophagus irregularis]|nr:hypothetical protein OCT59_012280 [Rhizophagus irregularis]GBC40183.2 hypothetical protein GLOIN_2v1762918 [Rhizophagus irregularis DAOM 181602=DAOM 197198]CAG8698303.1 2851_t:CDS:1 [Rhizophagus irregularis]
MDINYGKQVFDNYFVQAVTILTIFLVNGKGQFYEFFDDTFIFLSILLPTVLRFFLTDHLFWGLFITILGLILVYLLYQFHYTPPPKSNYENEKNKTYKFFRAFLRWFVRHSSLFPFYITIYIFYLPLSVEVHDDPSKKIVSPFESPEYINSFCLTKSNVIGCKISYYIRLYIVWFSIFICLIDFGLGYAFKKKNMYFPLKYLSLIRFIWFVVLSLTPGVVFGILLSDENYYLYKISSGLPISACVSIVRHYVGKDVHTFFSHYINLHRMFKMSIDNLVNVEVAMIQVDEKRKCDSKEIEKIRKNKMEDNCKKHKKGSRAWVRKNINITSTCILQITEKLKQKLISEHMIDKELDDIEKEVKQEKVLSGYKNVNSQFKKAITKRLEKNIGSNLKDEINSNLSQIIYSNYEKFISKNPKTEKDGKFNSNDNSLNPETEEDEKFNSNDNNETDDHSLIRSTLTNVKQKVTKLFQNFEDDMEGCGIYQILSEEDKDDIGRNSSNIGNIKAYLKNHEELLESSNKSSREELSEIKCDC